MVRDTGKLTNIVSLDEKGFVSIVYHGDQTRTSLTLVIERVMLIVEKLLENDKPVMVLADIRDMGVHTPAARMTGLRARTIIPFWKMAIITSRSDLYTAKISTIMTSMSGRRKEIKYFKSQLGAAKWLDKQ